MQLRTFMCWLFAMTMMVGCSTPPREDEEIVIDESNLSAADVVGTWYGERYRYGGPFRRLDITAAGKFEMLYNEWLVCDEDGIQSCPPPFEKKLTGTYSLGANEIVFTYDDPTLIKDDHVSFILGIGNPKVHFEPPIPGRRYQSMWLGWNREEPPGGFTRFYNYQLMKFLPGQFGEKGEYCVSQTAGAIGSCAAGFSCNGASEGLPYYRPGVFLDSFVGYCWRTVGLGARCGALSDTACAPGLLCDTGRTFDGFCITPPPIGATPSCGLGSCAAGQYCSESAFSIHCSM
jgi:hypothetical protein